MTNLTSISLLFHLLAIIAAAAPQEAAANPLMPLTITSDLAARVELDGKSLGVLSPGKRHEFLAPPVNILSSPTRWNPPTTTPHPGES